MLNRAFLFAGRASFIVENAAGEKVTVKVTKARESINRRTGQPFPTSYFISLRHNTAPWQYVGVMNESLQFSQTKKSMLPLTAREAQIAQWGIGVLYQNQVPPAGYVIRHTGRCGKCGKLLTDAVSIACGLGPICRG